MKERQRWQPEEDALLRAYVKQYGPKEWNLISHRMGKPLDRDPKSCLERWKNYLKPGIKKGSLSLEEQNLVISLQAKYGNKWKKIAAEVPGRTAKRLGKWWEVFKEKQLKNIQKSHPAPLSSAVRGGGFPEKALQGQYDHILETFAEKFVQPKIFAYQSLSISWPVKPNLEPPPVLSLRSEPVVSPTTPSCVLPPWMSLAALASRTTSSLSSSSTTPSPSVSLTLSPTEPMVTDPVQPQPDFPSPIRFLPVQQMGILIQYCKELEEGRQNWFQHKKEATWRLNRLEQQLESEKARKRREKMEDMEAKISCLRDEETAFLGRIESEYRGEIGNIQRDAESKEAKLIEAWQCKRVKLSKIVEKISVYRHGYTT